MYWSLLHSILTHYGLVMPYDNINLAQVMGISSVEKDNSN